MAASNYTSSAHSLPYPCPRSPPKYPDMSGKHRELVKVQKLEREIGFLEEELKSIEILQPASRSCKEVDDFVGANPDPLIPVNQKIHRPCRFWRWLCGKSCLNLSWICCSGGCSLTSINCVSCSSKSKNRHCVSCSSKNKNRWCCYCLGCCHRCSQSCSCQPSCSCCNCSCLGKISCRNCCCSCLFPSKKSCSDCCSCIRCTSCSSCLKCPKPCPKPCRCCCPNCTNISCNPCCLF